MIKKILHEPLFYLLPLLAVLYLAVIPMRHEISDVKITRNNITKNIQMPYLANMAKDEVFLISFKLYVKNKKSVKFNVVPDDCIQEILINGEKFPLYGIDGLCDYQNGIHFDFSKYVLEGMNSFELRIMNTGGPGGLRVEKSYMGFRSLSLMHYVFTLFFLLAAVLILRKFKFNFIAISIILLGIIVRLIVYAYTGPLHNPHDVEGHLHYIQIIAEEKRIPKIDEYFSTYHPPLYYIASAAIKNIVDIYDPNFTDRVLQQFSMLLSFGSIIFGVALILNLLGNCRFAYLASLLSVLWLGFVVAAPRIGNDVLFYFGASFCMLFAQRYWRLHKNIDILLASVGAAVALAAKSSGFVILGVWVIIYTLSAVRSLKIGSLRILLASALIIAFSILLSNYRSIVNIFEGKKIELVGNTRYAHDDQKIQSSIGNYLYFDLKDYLLFPYTSVWQDAGGRQYFWNFTIKSSLYLHKEAGAWKHPIGNVLDTTLCIFALLIFVLALWGIIHVKSKDIPPLLFTISLFAALIYFRAVYPYACSNEFRYILPVLFPFLYFSIRGVQILQDSRLRNFSYVFMLAFAGLSVLYIIGRAV
jgi:hypothetical protein